MTPIKAGALVGQLHAATYAEAVAAVLVKIKKLSDPKKPLKRLGQERRYKRGFAARCSEATRSRINVE